MLDLLHVQAPRAATPRRRRAASSASGGRRRGADDCHAREAGPGGGGWKVEPKRDGADGTGEVHRQVEVVQIIRRRCWEPVGGFGGVLGGGGTAAGAEILVVLLRGAGCRRDGEFDGACAAVYAQIL